MGDDEGDTNTRLVRRAVRDPEGNVRLGRVVDAVRGRRSAHRDLVPRLAVALLAALLVAPAVGYADYGTAAGAVEALGWGLVLYASLAVIWVTDRIEGYYEDDDDLAVEELRARYARGELSFETFQRLLDRVYEEGPGFVFEEDGDAGDGGDPGGEVTPTQPTSAGDDPLGILRRRFARGELTEAEYRSRVATLEETAGAAVEPEAAGGPRD